MTTQARFWAHVMIERLPADVCLEQAANCFAFEDVHTYMVYRSCCDIGKTAS